ncbi:coiled-coil domain-containing protein 70-like [Cataglyphis hispanica]|uniref:coiled-coil domain-containing protein 70-like n=1 Tax=Cataglyphis hispanica TaxID=1086592 RepID=UPI00217F7889|nr:coiled-coil domain-containing protein 70-like [Cataglyphis hispanica]
MIVRLKNEDQRREIWNKKKLLKGRKERILEDWTWKERRMRWRLEGIAREEEKKGRKVWIGYGKIRIDEKWWRWDEEEEVLKDGKGNLKKGEEVKKREKDGVVDKKWKRWRRWMEGWMERMEWMDGMRNRWKGRREWNGEEE